MKKNVLIFSFIIGLVLVLTACTGRDNVNANIGTNGSDDVNNGSGAAASTPNSGSSGGFVGKLSDALKLGGSYKCTVSTAEGAAQVTIKGSMYKQVVSSDQVSVTTISKTEGSKACAYSIMNVQGQNQCTKSCFDISAAQAESVSAENQQAQGNIRCTSAVVSDSEFATPGDCRDPFAGAPSGEF